MTTERNPHGGPRPNAGRRQLDGTPAGQPSPDPVERRTVTMPASYWAAVKVHGDGSYSEGLRRAVEALLSA